MAARREPFRYPKRPHVRRHGPQGYEDVESFRPWLRDEFQFRCVYCLDRESWTNTVASFHIDHFVAIANDGPREFDYDNLLYVCHACNLSKGSQRVPDPLKVLLSSTVVAQSDGRLHGKTSLAKKLIDLLRLNRPAYIARRSLINSIIGLAERFDAALLQKMLGYPDDLPDLSQLRPLVNIRPSGVRKSSFARRAAGTLPETY